MEKKNIVREKRYKFSLRNIALNKLLNENKVDLIL